VAIGAAEEDKRFAVSQDLGLEHFPEGDDLVVARDRVDQATFDAAQRRHEDRRTAGAEPERDPCEPIGRRVGKPSRHVPLVLVEDVHGESHGPQEPPARADERAAQNRTSGGSRDRDVNELTVIPTD
jgi:hypothetical protein